MNEQSSILLSMRKWQLVLALKYLRKVQRRPRWRNLGICGNLKHGTDWYELSRLPSSYAFVEELAVGWEHHSGKSGFPVPMQIQGSRDHWDPATEFGKLRRNLLSFIIGKVKARIKELESLEAGEQK